MIANWAESLLIVYTLVLYGLLNIFNFYKTIIVDTDS